MPEPMNDYAGAKDWRWKAIDGAKADLKSGLKEVNALLSAFAGAHTAPGEHHARRIRSVLRGALRRLDGGDHA
jgi:hypothetical protein